MLDSETKAQILKDRISYLRAQLSGNANPQIAEIPTGLFPENAKSSPEITESSFGKDYEATSKPKTRDYFL
ncbi:hypothetical protein DSO57_1025407 [Entomophthora muscae]|uniref:Uncharacterized protein n=1 Tax=Entomophthora muscae TaxID=34485 RepID=A0ACC2TPC2_9FUNG|nr:hypothetical protein DSO57_1025407 [Entomophthora muscae]